MGSAIIFGTFLFCLFLGVPVAVGLAIGAFAYITLSDIPWVVIPQKMYAGMDSFVLLCIPGFILAGNLMNGGGITQRIIRFANALVGWIKGGLGLSSIVGSMIFAGISGTAVAEAASIGAVMIPGMIRAGYPAPFAAALISSASTVGPIIPPSVPMIIVGALTGISVGRMFMAGALPGVLLGLGMMITCYVIANKRGYAHQPWQGWRELGKSFIGAIWALSMTVLILGGILSGQVTPTETAIVAALYAFVIGAFVHRGFGMKELPKILIDSTVASAAIIILVGFANVFGWILASEEIPQKIAAVVLSITHNKYMIILLINILLIMVGMFMETIAALIILFPTLIAVATGVGIDPVHFATFAIINLMIGLSTPPVGVCLFVCANIARQPLTIVIRQLMPFLVANLIVLLIVSYVPAVTLWLPNLLFGK
jgi:C4-dicarboxylate transporter DctM subunit